MFIFKCWVNMSVGNFIVKKKAWKHEKPIVLQWKCTKLYFTNCPPQSQTPQLWRHSWLELRAGGLLDEMQEMLRSEDCYPGLLSVAPGPPGHGSVSSSPAMSHTLVITAPARENLFLTDPQSVSGSPGGVGENINKVKSVDIWFLLSCPVPVSSPMIKCFNELFCIAWNFHVILIYLSVFILFIDHCN